MPLCRSLVAVGAGLLKSDEIMEGVGANISYELTHNQSPNHINIPEPRLRMEHSWDTMF